MFLKESKKRLDILKEGGKTKKRKANESSFVLKRV
jgi:hypothetical protein